MNQLRQMQERLRKYGATAFVVVGLAVVGATVWQVQNQELVLTRAEGEEEARAQGVWWDPSPVMVDETGKGEVRLKLESLQKVMKKVRLVFNYDADLLEVVGVEPGAVFGGKVDTDEAPGKLVLISEGEFMGSGTWVKLKVRLLGDQPARLVSDELLSQLQYEDGRSVEVGKFDVLVRR